MMKLSRYLQDWILKIRTSAHSWLFINACKKLSEKDLINLVSMMLVVMGDLAIVSLLLWTLFLLIIVLLKIFQDLI